MLGSCFRYEIQKLAISTLRKLYKDETNPIAIHAVEFRIEAWLYCNHNCIFERWYFYGFQEKLPRKIFDESLSIHCEQAQLYRSHRLFLCCHCKIKGEKGSLVIDSGNLAILNHSLFPETNSYSSLPSFLLYFLPPPSLTSSSLLASSFPHSFHFFLIFFHNNIFLPPIYIMYLFPVHTAIKPATMQSTTIPYKL